MLAELGHLHGLEANSFAAKFKVTCRSCTEHQGRANHANPSAQSTGPVPLGHLTPEVTVSFSWVTFAGSVFPGMSGLLPPEALPPGSPPTGPLADPLPSSASPGRPECSMEPVWQAQWKVVSLGPCPTPALPCTTAP